MYEGEFFPGTITDIGSGNQIEDYKVSTMTMGGPCLNWKWPDKIDEYWYNKTKVKEKIAAFTPINDSRTFAHSGCRKMAFHEQRNQVKCLKPV